MVYFAHNIDPDAPAQVPALSAAIRAANPDAVIGVDEEGGNVTRLQARDGSSIPGAAVLGALNDLATTAGRGPRHWPPVPRRRHQPDHCPRGGRQHEPAATPSLACVPSAPTPPWSAPTRPPPCTGIQTQRVAACAKHFPGHGDTVADSHMDTARVELTMAEMAEFHLPPFKAATEAGVAAMMSAHIIIPELGEAPATLNPAASALLRGMGFEGVLITDALDMAAVRATVGPGEGGVLALLAGNDLLCVGNPLNAYTTGRDDESCYVEVYDALFAAVASGRLPVETLRTGRRPRAGTGAVVCRGSLRMAGDDDVDWVSVAARAARVDSPPPRPCCPVRAP